MHICDGDSSVFLWYSQLSGQGQVEGHRRVSLWSKNIKIRPLLAASAVNGTRLVIVGAFAANVQMHLDYSICQRLKNTFYVLT